MLQMRKGSAKPIRAVATRRRALYSKYMNDFDAIAFAGGGNRCYWQAGFWQALNEARAQNPQFVVGVSAGAFQAAVALAGLGARQRELVFAACAQKPKPLEWSRLLSGRSPFVVGDMYRRLLEQLFDSAALTALRQAPPLYIQIAHPPALMPGAIAALGAIGAYQIEKLVTGAAHSRAGLYVGMRAQWISTHGVARPSDLADALMASSSVPPFMPIGRIGERAALDGGLVDNPPLGKISAVEKSGGRTLVLATRPRAPEANGARVVVTPSTPLIVNKFAVDDADGLRNAYELGLKDGAAFARSL
jgi:predicted acylesterase/phospholipase RssA